MLDLIRTILSQFWKELIQGILDIVFNVLNAIPVPDFISQLPTYASQLGGATYWLDVLNVGTGMTLVISAYVIRFTIRRIPFIG